MNVSTQKYYLIVLAIKKGDFERIYPLVISEREEADRVFALMAEDNIIDDSIFELIGDVGDVAAHPFLYVEKTYMSNDKINLNSDEHEDTGEITSEMIPVDYVSEVISYRQYPRLKTSRQIKSIIDHARFGEDRIEEGVV